MELRIGWNENILELLRTTSNTFSRLLKVSPCPVVNRMKAAPLGLESVFSLLRQRLKVMVDAARSIYDDAVGMRTCYCFWDRN